MFEPKANSVMLHHVPRGTRTRRCCRRAFLRGLFIACGHVREPERAYLMEFATDSAERAQTLSLLLRDSGLTPHTRRRGEEEVVAVERGDEVTDLLALMGAHQALFAMEDARIRRSASGTANRQTNCDTANTARLLNTAARQHDMITVYAKTHGLDGLPPRLREIAGLRLQYPSAALQELGSYCRPPIGKAAVSLRFRELLALIAPADGSE